MSLMQKLLTIICAVITALFSSACGDIEQLVSEVTSSVLSDGFGSSQNDPEEISEEDDKVSDGIMYITANGTVFRALLADNSSAEALVSLLKNGDITINAHDYGGFEKVGELPESLPRNDEQITTSAGDLILYQGNKFVFYYDTNSWSFTRLGRVEGYTTAQLIEIFGSGDVTLKLSLSDPS